MWFIDSFRSPKLISRNSRTYVRPSIRRTVGSSWEFPTYVGSWLIFPTYLWAYLVMCSNSISHFCLVRWSVIRSVHPQSTFLHCWAQFSSELNHIWYRPSPINVSNSISHSRSVCWLVSRSIRHHSTFLHSRANRFHLIITIFGTDLPLAYPNNSRQN